MNIIVDAMGGDNAPSEIVKGCVEAIKLKNINITLVGQENVIKEELNKYKIENSKMNNINIVNADEIISNNDVPTSAIRTKKNSSMVVGLRMLKEGKGDAFISAGSTGALLTGGTLIVGRIKGIDRPALAPIIPTKKGMMVLLDAGANADCKPINLVQFSILGNTYSKRVLGVNSPKVGIINIGSEEEKGNMLTKEVHGILKNESSINFYGNVEGRDVPEGVVDVLVCDGFVGNVLLKVYEGVSITLFGMIKKVFMKNAITKLCALILKGGLKDLKNQLDYSEVGGAPLLGINSIVIKAHGSSDYKAISNAIGQAAKFVDSNFVDEIKDELKKPTAND